MGYDKKAMLAQQFNDRHPREPPGYFGKPNMCKIAAGATRPHSSTLLGMTTRGDQILDRSLSKVGGKGLFVKELEVALGGRPGRPGRAFTQSTYPDGVAGRFHAGLRAWSAKTRAMPGSRNRYATLADLPQGAVVGYVRACGAWRCRAPCARI